MVAADEQLHVLIIDDDSAMRELLTHILSPGGHQLIIASSAEEGLEQLPYFTFQVAFLDHNLPGMEGLVLGEYLRKNNPHMEIALVTGQPDARLERVSREHKIVFISKPFEVASILDVVTGYRTKAAERFQARRSHNDPHFAPPIGAYAQELTECFAMPGVPSRIEDRLAVRIQNSMANLQTAARYNERDRVIALSGLLAAQVLGIKLPRHNGMTLFSLYDELMEQHGRRKEFADGPLSEH